MLLDSKKSKMLQQTMEFWLLLALSLVSIGTAEVNHIRNPDFEGEWREKWKCLMDECQLELSQDSFSGERSLKVFNRCFTYF